MEERRWYRYDFSKSCDHLIVGFGSVRMFIDREMNKGFEWDNLLKYKFGDLTFNVLFVGDLNNSWWHTNYEGLPGHGPYILRDFLLEKIKQSGATKTLYLGVSMGGYGALLFGCLTKATKVMAFSPQTMLTNARKKKNLNRAFEGFEIDETLTDLKQVLEEKNNHETIYNIWYGRLNNSDTKAAKRVSHIDNVFIHPIESSKHNVVKPTIESGVFRKEIEKFLTKNR